MTRKHENTNDFSTEILKIFRLPSFEESKTLKYVYNCDIENISNCISSDLKQLNEIITYSIILPLFNRLRNAQNDNKIFNLLANCKNIHCANFSDIHQNIQNIITKSNHQNSDEAGIIFKNFNFLINKALLNMLEQNMFFEIKQILEIQSLEISPRNLLHAIQYPIIANLNSTSIEMFNIKIQESAFLVSSFFAKINQDTKNTIISDVLKNTEKTIEHMVMKLNESKTHNIDGIGQDLGIIDLDKNFQTLQQLRTNKIILENLARHDLDTHHEIRR